MSRSSDSPGEPTAAGGFSAREPEARTAAGGNAARWMRLQAATAAFSRAPTPDEVAAVAAGPGAAALGGARGCVLLPDASGALQPLRCEEVEPLEPRILAHAAAALRSGCPVFLEALDPPDPGDPGAARRAGVALMPLQVEGRALGVLVVLFDGPRLLTEEEQDLAGAVAAECAQALARARVLREAQLAVRAREEFLQVASHELRGPLGTLRLAVQLLERDLAAAGEGGPARSRARIIERQADRLVRLADTLLDVSRITAGQLVLEREPADLAALVQDAAARLAEEARAAGCVVSLRTPAPVHAQLDVQRMDQVITNLLSNALKYGRGAPVEVAVTEEGGRALLVVQDRGIGISPADQERIFGRFERAVSVRNYGGLGLGLWIVRRLVEAHGGSISVESAPGAGARFAVSIPAPAA